MLEHEHVGDFARDGYVILRDFYHFEEQIRPIQEGIREVIELIASKHHIDVDCSTPEAAMTEGYRSLISADRALGSEVYDAVKQIPAFMQLVSHAANADLFAKIRPNSRPGLAAGGYGIRIDNPGEERFRAYWHQEFPAQLRSLDGIVFWSPLLEVSAQMGPVELCVKSHEGGLRPVIQDEGGVGRSGAYALRLEDEENVVAGYDRIAPLTRPGDLILIDFLTLHQSGHNVSDRPRWSMQFRYFNFRDPLGLRISWKGSFASGNDFTEILNSQLVEQN